MPDNAIQLILNEWLLAVFNPQKRIFWGYLLSSLLIAILWLRLINDMEIEKMIVESGKNQQGLDDDPYEETKPENILSKL